MAVHVPVSPDVLQWLVEWSGKDPEDFRDEALIREIESGPHEQQEIREVLVPTSLVVRGSTAPPRRGWA